MALLKNTYRFGVISKGGHLKRKIKLFQTSKYLKFNYRVKGSTLMETLVATVLIVIIFMVASMTMNNLLSRNVKQNTELAEERLNALAYQYKNGGIKLPYYEDFNVWEIVILEDNQGAIPLVILEAEHTKTKKMVTNYMNREN